MFNQNNKFIISFIILLCKQSLLLAQQPILSSPKNLYRHFEQSINGLASNCVYGINKDIQGYIWLSTSKGMQVFDGKNFTNIHLPDLDQEVISTYKTLNNHLLCYTISGNMVDIDFKTRESKMIYYRCDGSPILISAPIGDSMYFINNSNKLWSTSNQLVNTKLPEREAISESKMNQYDYINQWLHYEKIKINPDELLKAFKKNPKSLKIFHDNFILENKIYSKINNEWKIIYDGSIMEKSNDIISTFLHYGNDLIVGFLNKTGLIYYKNYFENTKIISKQILLSDIIPSDLNIDAQDNILVSSSESGFYIILSDMFNMKYYNCRDTSIFYQQSIDYIHVQPNVLITGYNNKRVDVKLNNINYKIIYDNSTQRNCIVGAFFKANKSICLFSEKDTKEIEINPPFKILHQYSWVANDVYVQDGFAYIGLKNYYCVYPQNSPDTFHLNYNDYNIQSFAPNYSTGYFFGTINGLFNSETQKKVSFIGNVHINKTRNYNGIIVSTSPVGIFLNNRNNKIKQLSTKNGLPSNYCKDIVWNGNNIIYVLTDAGIVAIDTFNFKVISTFNTVNLYPQFTINTFCYFQNKLWLGTTKGIITIDEDIFLKKGKIKYNIPSYIYIYNKEKKFFNSDTSEITYNKNLQLNVFFDILDFSGGQINYNYCIKDDENNYVLEPTKTLNPNFLLNSLDPGKYLIEIEAFNNEYDWKVLKKHTLIIKPLWWQTIWSKIAIALLFLSTIFFIIKSLLSNISNTHKQEQNVLNLKNKLQLNRLKPHFIFNAFNPLQVMIAKNDLMGSLNYIEKFSGLMRNSINMFNYDTITLDKELIFLDQYVAVQQERFSNKIIFIKAVPDIKIQQCIQIQNMLIQPIIENAIEHGLPENENSENKIILNIELNKQATILNVIIQDSGKGFPENFLPIKDHAIAMLQEQINLMNKKDYISSIKFTTNDLGGCVNLTIPVKLI